MDFNDLNTRLKRLYSSVGKSSDGEIEKYVKIIKTDEHFDFLISFNNGQDDSETIDLAIAVIEHIAKLKDHLKNYLEKRSEPKQLIEDAINESLALQIIIDLSNAEKHGYPTRTNRSKKNPKIKNLHHALSIPPLGTVSFNLTTGEVVDAGDSEIIITADIFSDDDQLLYRFPTLINEAIKKWEDIMDKLDIIGDDAN